MYKFTVGHDLIYTLCAWQGLANQDNPTKIYFENVPSRIFFDMRDGGPGNASEEFLEDGLVPFPQTRPKLDYSKRFPALSWMLENHADKVKGLVLVPGIDGPEWVTPAISGARATGINACTFEGYLPVSPVIYKYLLEEGLEGELKADYRHMTNLEALKYSIDRWIDHPKRSDRMVGFYSEFASNSGAMADYFVDSGIFCYFLQHKKGRQNISIDDTEWHRLILNEDYYPQGTVVFGSVELPLAIVPIEEAGYTCVEGYVANASVTSSIPENAVEFRPAEPAKALPIKPGALYLAFHGNDGDAIDFNFYPTTKNLRNDPHAGEIPMGVKVNPYMIDLFPTLYAWYTELYSESTDLIPSMNNGGPSRTEAGREYWRAVSKDYFERANNSFQIGHFFGQVEGGAPAKVDDFPMFYYFIGYQNREPDMIWIYEDGMLRSNMIGSAYSSAEGLAKLISRTAKVDFEADEPAFILGRLGSDPQRKINVRRGTLPYSMAKWTVDALKAEPGFDREIILCRPSDLAKTWLEYHDQEQDR